MSSSLPGYRHHAGAAGAVPTMLAVCERLKANNKHNGTLSAPDITPVAGGLKSPIRIESASIRIESASDQEMCPCANSKRHCIKNMKLISFILADTTMGVLCLACCTCVAYLFVHIAEQQLR